MMVSEAVEQYLRTIHERDLEGISKLFYKSPDLTIILPNGMQFVGYDRVVAMHRDWFSDPDWRCQFDLVRTVEVDKTAISIIKVDYRDKNPQGADTRLNYYLSLTWVEIAGSWVVIHDQNTLIKE